MQGNKSGFILCKLRAEFLFNQFKRILPYSKFIAIKFLYIPQHQIFNVYPLFFSFYCHINMVAQRNDSIIVYLIINMNSCIINNFFRKLYMLDRHCFQ